MEINNERNNEILKAIALRNRMRVGCAIFHKVYIISAFKSYKNVKLDNTNIKPPDGHAGSMAERVLRAREG